MLEANDLEFPAESSSNCAKLAIIFVKFVKMLKSAGFSKNTGIFERKVV